MVQTADDDISQAERTRVLREDRLATTYHAASRAFVDEDRGGRFAVLEKATVTGAGPVRYPKLASGPWSEGPGGGPEPPLGFDVNAVEAVGEVHERKPAEGKVASSGKLRRRI